jgi:hypothetical protein
MERDVRYQSKPFLTMLAIVSILLVGGVWLWFVRIQSPAFRFVMVGGRNSVSNGFGISSGNVVAVAGRPAVLFGTVTEPGASERFTYLIFFKFKISPPYEDNPLSGLDFHCSSNGEKAEAQDGFVINGKRVEVAYRIELDKLRGGPPIETLEVGGMSVDVAAGKVFLVDLTNGPPVYRQRAVSLPPGFPKLEKTADVERFVDELRQSLESKDHEVRDFLR